MQSFVHLHVHSEYSMKPGLPPIEALANEASEGKMPALALTDLGNLFGAIKHAEACKENGLKPIFGCELQIGSENQIYDLVLLCANETGYKNLCQLLSNSMLPWEFGGRVIDREALPGSVDGLICLSCFYGGEINQHIAKEEWEGAKTAANWLCQIFGCDNLYFELQRHGFPHEDKLIEVNRKLAETLGIGVVATHFSNEHVVKNGTSKNKSCSNLKSCREMNQVFSDIPEALENSLKIAEKCQFDFLPAEKQQKLSVKVPLGHTAQTYFKQMVRQGLKERKIRLRELETQGRLKNSIDDYHKRLDREIDTILNLGGESYFLFIWDLVRFAKEQDIAVGSGRGYYPGSLVAYVLHLSDIDPLQHGLIFELFLDGEQEYVPAWVFDLCFERRGEVFQYIHRTYGDEYVCQLMAFSRFRAKMNNGEIHRFLKAQAHAAGVVVSDVPIQGLAPTIRGGLIGSCIQFDSGDAEYLGLPRLFLLGLRTITLIAETRRRIEERNGSGYVLKNFDSLDDPKTFSQLSKGVTDGIFQLERSRAVELLKKLKPRRFEELLNIVALCRIYDLHPDIVEQCLLSKRSGKTAFKLPDLEPILKDTLGHILFREQIIEIVHYLGNMSYESGVRFLKTLRFGGDKEIHRARERFFEGVYGSGSPNQFVMADIFDDLVRAARFAVLKSHFAAYTKMTYQMAYLKTHFSKINYN